MAIKDHRMLITQRELKRFADSRRDCEHGNKSVFRKFSTYLESNAINPRMRYDGGVGLGHGIIGGHSFS